MIKQYHERFVKNQTRCIQARQYLILHKMKPKKWIHYIFLNSKAEKIYVNGLKYTEKTKSFTFECV
jgi:hypothetical protein